MATSKRIQLYGLQPVVGDLVKKNFNNNTNDIIKLTDENINEYRIVDVVLPLPGYSILLPDNKCKRIVVFFNFLKLKLFSFTSAE
jgi:tRNA(Glu) U13 pseudouridine synthase TruD